MEFPRFTFNPKEGIDNPALVISDDPEPNPCLVPRLCQLICTEGQSFGFQLRAVQGRRGHTVWEVDPHSPAEVGGLREGYRVLEVNQEYVDNMEFPEIIFHGVSQVPQPVAGNLSPTLATVTRNPYRAWASPSEKPCGRESASSCIKHRVPVVPTWPSAWVWPTGPGPLRLEAGPDGYGFLLRQERLATQRKDRGGAVSSSLDLQALARSHRCGNRARLCHVTRNPVQGLGITIRHVEVPDRHTLSTSSSLCCYDVSITRHRIGNLFSTTTTIESASSCIKHRVPVVPDLAECLGLAHRPRTLRLEQGPDGYGFLLRQERLATQRKAGSPAEEAGMEDGELVLAVNGVAMETAEHKHVVRKIRESGQSVTLTTISLPGRDYYRQLGLSPLLFYDEDLKETQSGPKDPRNSISCAEPRLCVLDREPAGFGFHLCCVQERPGTFISQVAPGGSGQRAGLQGWEAIVEVDGQNVKDRSLEEVGALIKGGSSPLRLLVVERTEGGPLGRNEPPDTQAWMKA
ncbi:hypothetical protein CRUP_021377 [Coryphaenoides rupestris]|nr:hypothetical protein CRUP_021377 [Coryphaenoides rupestris]